MKCPHCTVSFHDNWEAKTMSRGNLMLAWNYRTAHCPACDKIILEMFSRGFSNFRQLIPIGGSRGPTPNEVPEAIAQDYEEACNVLPLSPKASAALSRRCLQNMLRANGYKAKDLAQEIDLLIGESDPRKAIPETLRVTVDAIRNFGNFSAHPITAITSQQIIDVEDHEAEFCLEVLEEAFQHFYVRPAQAHARKAALDAKLSQAGKPPSK